MVAPQNLAVLLQRIDCDVLGSGGINNPVFRHMMGALAADRTGSVAVGTAVTCRPPAQNRSTRSLMRQPWRVRVGSKSSSCRDSTDATNSAETGLSPVKYGLLYLCGGDVRNRGSSFTEQRAPHFFFS